MKVMVIVKATESSEAGEMPDEKLMAEMGKFNEALVDAGIMKAGEGLKPSSEGLRVHFSGANRTVTDGPFAETKELVAGFWMWDVRSLDEAVEWVKRCPNPMIEDSEIEIRPLFEIEDFADSDPSGELMENENRLRETIEARTKTSSDEQQIHDLIEKWRAALQRKDVEAMMEDYAPDAVLFDACPPYKTEGVDGIRGVWENCLPYFPEKFKSEHRDLQVHVGDDVAFVYGIHHFVPEPADHPCGQTWMRVTLGFRRIDDKWKVAHEHASIPFNPMTNQAWQISDPDKLDMPDYSAEPNTQENTP